MGLLSKKKKEVIPEIGNALPPPGAGGRAPAPSVRSQASTAAPSYRTAPSYVPPSQGGAGYGGQGSHWDRQPPASYGAGGNHSAPSMQPPPQQQRGGGGNGYYNNNNISSQPPSQGQQYGRQVAGNGDRKMGGGYGSAPTPTGGRNELLAGAPSRYGGGNYSDHQYGAQNGSFQHGINPEQSAAQAEEEEEVEGIKQQMRFVKQESLASTRNAVRIAQEAEETARATLDKLGDQSDRIANTERHLDLAKAHNERAVDETKELEALNRSIFRPNFTLNKARKRDKEEARLLARHNNEQAEREEVRREQYESRQRIEGTYRGMDRDAENAAAAKSRAKARGSERGRYQFEATESDDEVEDEIDRNLDEISGLAGRLKMLATTAGQEVDAQNVKLSKLGSKVDTLDNKIHSSTARLARVK